MGDYVDSAIYPFREVYDTGLKPEGADKAVRKMVDGAFPQLAAILQSGADVLGVAPEQISPFISYKRPETPGYSEAKYAASLGAQFGGLLSGDTDEAVRDALRTSAIESLKDIGKDLAVDIVTQALPSVPGVPLAGVVQVGIQIFENKDLLKTTEGRQQLAKQAGFAIASFVPGINIIAAPVGVIMTVASLSKAKEHMAAEIHRSKEMMKMIDDCVNAALEEARGLSVELAERGVSMRTDADTAWTGRLRKHYEELLLVRIDDQNLALDLAKAKWYAQGAGYVAAHWEDRSSFDHVPRELGRKDNIRIFLQFARDIHKVREALKGKLAPVGSAGKSSEQVAAEIQSVASAMLAKNPLMPIQEALNLAGAMARGAPMAINQPGAAASFAQSVASQVKANSAILASGGAVALMLGIKFLPMLLKRGAK